MHESSVFISKSISTVKLRMRQEEESEDKGRANVHFSTFSSLPSTVNHSPSSTTKSSQKTHERNQPHLCLLVIGGFFTALSPSPRLLLCAHVCLSSLGFTWHHERNEGEVESEAK